MVYFKIIQNIEGSKYKFTVMCSKCKNEFERNDLFFCSYECVVCKKKMVNPNHQGYHTRAHCYFEKFGLSPDHEKELEERNKDATVKNLKIEKVAQAQRDIIT